MEIDIFLSLFLFILLYVSLLFIAKNIGWLKKKVVENCSNACPNCEDALNRIPRKQSDHLIINITFRIFDFRRYQCDNCNWQGLKWESRFK